MKEEKNESGPQIEDGHIDIANEIVEAIAKTYLSSYETRIIFALWRMTWGYAERDKDGHYITKLNRKGNRQVVKREMARITSKKWISLTGLKKGNISRTLKRLCQRNIVIKTGNKYGSITWGFQKHYKQWDKEGFVIHIDNKNIVIQTDNNLLSKQITPVIQTDNKIIPKSLKNKALPDHEENSLKKTYIKKEKNDIYFLEKEEENTKEKEIFNYWNSLNIFEHKTFNFFKDDIKEALKNYSLEEIKNTIKNYSLILRGEKYYYTYEHTISGFLEPKNFEKFKDLEKAEENYQVKKINNKPDQEAVEYLRYKPAPGIKETGEERKARYKESEKKIKELKEGLNHNN